MPKNIAKILRRTTDRIFIVTSYDLTEPLWFATDEVGYTDEASLKIDSKKSTINEAGGNSIQLNTDYDLKLSEMQILDESDLIKKKNKVVWIMVKPTGTVSVTNPEIKVKNFLLNIEPMTDLDKSGKSRINISGSKSENVESRVYEFITTETVLTDVFDIFNPDAL